MVADENQVAHEATIQTYGFGFHTLGGFIVDQNSILKVMWQLGHTTEGCEVVLEIFTAPQCCLYMPPES